MIIRVEGFITGILLFVLLQPLVLSAQAGKSTRIFVDLSDAPKNIVHVQLSIPVAPGPLTLVYPKWIPGDASPVGPIGNLAGLVMIVDGKILQWHRDDVDMYAFHVEVPKNATTLQLNLDFLAVSSTAQYANNASVATTRNLAVLAWHLVVLYPEDAKHSDLLFEPAVKLPKGWQYASALTTTSAVGNEIHFAPVSLERLVDSPLLAGKYFKRIAIAPNVIPRHFIDIAAESPNDLDVKREQFQGLNNLVYQAQALFKSQHFDSYDFLVALSPKMAPFFHMSGQEHHESSDNRGPEGAFTDPCHALEIGLVLSHEYAHSWNGKYRRPAGQITRNFQEPLKDELLWVYEGLTEYLGYVLAVRSGAWTAEDFRSFIASDAAEMSHRPGREWRDLEDVAVGEPALIMTNREWGSWRRSADFYAEGGLVWLDVDTKIRQLTGNRKSLDDFCAVFWGAAGDTRAKVVPYTFQDLVTVLRAVVDYDWSDFLEMRLHSKVLAPLDGIKNGGWVLKYGEQPSRLERTTEIKSGILNAWYSIGLRIKNDGTIVDVLYGSLADKSGIWPGARIVSVNGHEFSREWLREVLGSSKNTKELTKLTLRDVGDEATITLDYDGGEAYPYLERHQDTPDLLDQIAKPLIIKAPNP